MIEGPTPFALPKILNDMTTTTTTSLSSRVRDMKPGAKLTVGIEEYSWNTLRRYACDWGLLYQRVYSVHVDRATRTYTITRKS